jgi:hypothetical protein
MVRNKQRTFHSENKNKEERTVILHSNLQTRIKIHSVQVG